MSKAAYAAIDQVFALARAVQTARHYNFAGLSGEDRFVAPLFPPLAFQKFGHVGSDFFRLRCGILRFYSFLLRVGGQRGVQRENLYVRVVRIGRQGGVVSCCGSESRSLLRGAFHRGAFKDEPRCFRQLGVFHGDGYFSHSQRGPLDGPIEDAVGHPLGAERLVALLAEYPGNGVDHVGFAAAVRPDDACRARAAKSHHGAVTKGLKANNFHFSELKQDVPFLSSTVSRPRLLLVTASRLLPTRSAFPKPGSH
jgi:hypothetical protein